MKQALTLLMLAALMAPCALAQQPGPTPPGEDAVKISDHVWMIKGNPNIAVVVGNRATLVVDTGLGPKNGAAAARVAAKLAPANSKLFLTTTHFHPEHATGESGFPPGTILIRNRTQQQQMEKHGQQMIDIFSSRSETSKELLNGVVMRTPDVVFDQEATVDLGGVTARLLWYGAAHTLGDELTFVDPDRTLISGDVVQNKTAPNVFAAWDTADEGGPSTSWLAVLDKVALLNPQHIVPDHSEPGDGSLVALEKDLITFVRGRALALKSQGVSADEAGKQISAELKSRHPDWGNTNCAGFVTRVYEESQ